MIDDESKKFIKETIENAIDSKLSEQEKKTESQRKLDSMKYEKKELEDRRKLLAELSEREKKGQATIAERFEKLKLSVDTAIPKDLKDAWKTGTQGVQAGANQVGKGIGHLTQRAMMSNPLTAFLYQNRDIAGAAWDIGAGSVKAGWGALKGLGHGALGLANAAKNLFTKNEEGETEEELNLPKPKFLGNDTQAEKIVKEKNGWEKQIDEMHKIMTKDLIKEQKSSNTVLSKGLKGLDEGMKAVKGFTDMIAAKQKLILGGIMLGAAAILGLAAWFKGGGLQNLLLGGNKDNNILVPDTVSDKPVDAGLSGDAWKDAVTKKVEKGDFGKITDVQRGSGWKKDDSILGTWKHGDKLSKQGKSSFKFSTDDNKEMVIRAPFDCYIKEVQFCTHKHSDGSYGYGDEKGYYRIYIEQVHTKKQGVSDVSWSQYEYCIYPVYDPKFTKQPRTKDKNKSYKIVPKGTILGYAHGNYFIVPKDKGAYESFESKIGSYTLDQNTEFKNNYKDSIEQTTNFRTEDDAQAARTNTVDVGQSLKYNKKMGEAKTVGDKVKTGLGMAASETLQAVGGEDYEEAAYKKAAPGALTGPAASISVNRVKAEEQNKKLNEKKEEPIREQGISEGQGYSGQLPSLTVKENDNQRHYQYADLRSTGDINLMTPNGTTNIGAI